MNWNWTALMWGLPAIVAWSVAYDLLDASLWVGHVVSGVLGLIVGGFLIRWGDA